MLWIFLPIKSFFHANTQVCENFVAAVREAILFINAHPKEAMQEYYTYSKVAKTPLMDDILRATMECFDLNFSSSFAKELPILEFFNEIGITNLNAQTFKTAFLN